MAGVTTCRIGSNALPKDSATSPKATLILAESVAVASAAPPNCVSSSARIISCALRVSPTATNVLMLFSCSSLNRTPARRRAVRPRIGSCKALPSRTALSSPVPPNTAAMSKADCVALSNEPPATSAVAANSLKLSSCA